MRVPWRG